MTDEQRGYSENAEAQAEGAVEERVEGTAEAKVEGTAEAQAEGAAEAQLETSPDKQAEGASELQPKSFSELHFESAPEPQPKREHPAFGLSRIGLAIIAVLMVGLVAWHVGTASNVSSVGRDAGGFAGGSDYGGGGYDYGGSSYDYDWGGSSYDYDYDWDWDWDSGSSYSGGDFGWLDVAIILIIVIGLLGPAFLPTLPRNKEHKPKQSRAPQPAGATPTPSSQLKPISKLQERDPGFSSAAIDEMIANVYVRMQQAWTAGNFEPMRPYFSNALFSQFANQLDALNKKGWTNYVEGIAVLEAKVRGWYETNDSEYLVMKVRTRIIDYTMDKSGNVVGGYTNKESYMEYEYTLARPAGMLTTGQTSQTEAAECPNCGAPINLAQSAKCEYCGTVVESKRFTWVISGIKGISQQIVG